MYVVQYYESGWWLTWTKHFTESGAKDQINELKKEFPTEQFRVRLYNAGAEL